MIYLVFKRFSDILISALLVPFVLLTLLILYPIYLFFYGGNIIYKTKRLGENARIFTMYKIRTMKINSPDIRNDDGSTVITIKDSRVFYLGKILRKLSIDELPQLYNVLKGDMSLVGPRPPLSDLNLSTLDNETKKRFLVKPGITGYSQAFYRNSISQDQQFINDVYYVNNISFKLDFIIVIKTIKSVLFGANIYKDGKQI